MARVSTVRYIGIVDINLPYRYRTVIYGRSPLVRYRNLIGVAVMVVPTELKVKADAKLQAQIQFKLSRVSLLEMHYALDRYGTVRYGTVVKSNIFIVARGTRQIYGIYHDNVYEIY